MQDVKKIIDYLKERAIKSMRQNNGILDPKMYFLILYPGQNTPVYYPVPQVSSFFTQGLKKHLPAHAQTSWNKKKAASPAGIVLVAVCLISDTWMTEHPYDHIDTPDEMRAEIKKLKNEPRPSQDPKRFEVLMVYINYPDRQMCRQFRYIRKGKNLEFTEVDYGELAMVDGIMAHLFPTEL